MTFICSFPQEDLGFWCSPPPRPHLKEKNISLLLLMFLIAEMKEHRESCPLIFQQSYSGVSQTLTVKIRGFSL